MKSDRKKLANARGLALLLLGLFGVVLGAVLQVSGFPVRSGAAATDTSHHEGSRFVFADLDGDRIPDFALVEMQGQKSARSDYAIRIRLSAGAESAVGVSGPIGGLRVAARDVNGDHHLDLVVTADLDAEFIEVLLNDGQGNFSAAAPTEFLRRESQSDVAVRHPAVPAEVAMLATVCPSGGETDVRSPTGDQAPSAEVGSYPAVRPALQRAARSSFGRSPPAVTFP